MSPSQSSRMQARASYVLTSNHNSSGYLDDPHYLASAEARFREDVEIKAISIEPFRPAVDFCRELPSPTCEVLLVIFPTITIYEIE